MLYRVIYRKEFECSKLVEADSAESAIDICSKAVDMKPDTEEFLGNSDFTTIPEKDLNPELVDGNGGTIMVNANERRFRGRKLILNWGNLKLELSKLPYLNNKDKLIFDLFESDVLLANVYETPDGHLEDEILGKPAGWRGDGTMLGGYRIEDYATDDGYWKTIGEVTATTL